MAFRVGQKVTLANDLPWLVNKGECVPVFGTIYTIREFWEAGGRTGLRFDEIHNEPRTYAEGFFEVAFNIVRFRPVVSRPTDISIFTRILDETYAPRVPAMTGG
jgi:hypothetical protein